METHQSLLNELHRLSNQKKAKVLQRFFKTGQGEYGEGDQFLGIKVPVQRQIAKEFKDLELNEVEILLQNPLHEARLTALFILVHQFKKGNDIQRKNICDLYLNNKIFVNNWDLVDSSAEHIVGAWLIDKDKSILLELAQSNSLWDRRIAVISTFHFIKNKQPEWTLKIAEILLKDKEDLIHKAVGWMLREIGNRCSLEIEEQFLEKNYQQMPRTMLRYAIEKMAEPRRLFWLKRE